MDIKEEFRITRVPDTVINKKDAERAIDAQCQKIREKLLLFCPVLEPYSDLIYVRYGKTIVGGTPAYAVIILNAFVLIAEQSLRDHLTLMVEQAGRNLHHQLRVPAVA